LHTVNEAIEHDTNKKTALVAGATSVVGRNLLRWLVSDPDWDVIAVSRRKPDVEGEYRHIASDLLDPADAKARLGGLSEATHIRPKAA
jgi:nucleoside-diphosphate-sugar epimerase